MDKRDYSAPVKSPSRALLAWRRFVVETVVCLVLVGAIIVTTLRAREEVLAGAAVLALASMIVTIVSRRW